MFVTRLAPCFRPALARPKGAWNENRRKEALTPRRRGKGPRRGQNGADHEGERNQDLELRLREDYPWFSGCPGDSSAVERAELEGGLEFDGKRRSDLQLANASRRAAWARRAVEAGRREGDAR